MRSYPHTRALALVFFVLFVAASAHAQISGHLTVCRGASRTTLSGTPSGGTWASGDVSKATVNSSTGEVAGVAAGTATISYTDPSSTVHTAVVTVNGYVMGNIGFSMGSDIRCTGGVPSTCTVSPLIGNNWTSSDPSIATINTGGSVVPSATNAGTVTISYRHAYGNCYVTRGMTVNPTPTVSIINPVCAGVTQTATGTPTGGTWMSSNNSVGTINTTTGVLSSFIGGGTYIRYTVGGCYRQPFLTVSAGVAAFGGSTTVCVGNSSTLTCASSGGTWSSTDPSVATIGSSTGVVTGVSLGTATISYVIGSSCFRTAVVTVNAGPSASAGPDEVCAGQTISLTNATGGGSWSSSNTSRAIVTTYGGTVTGVSAGTVNISYRVAGGCAAIKTITVNVPMAAITGGPNVCEGASVSLSHALTGGTWVASNANATVDGSTGLLTGITAGSVNITYTASPGCVKAQMMIVKPTPAPISGVLSVCPGATTALSSASGGGAWSSSDPSVATVSSYGVVSGASGGTATITYTVASWGCSATAVVTVSSTGSGISGSTALCLGSGTTLSASPAGGMWASSNGSVATIGSSTGVVTTVGVGTTTISYSTGGGCLSIAVVTVSAIPSTIAGATGLCVGSTATLTNSVSGGVWTSDNTSVATIGTSSGIVSAVASGTAGITYTTGPGCFSTVVVTVASAPGSIGGISALCVGSSLTLTNSVGGGSWVSSDAGIATIGSLTGLVNGIAPGTATITYSLGSGCETTAVLTVNAGPSAIGGPSVICAGLSSTLTNSVSGGTWSSSNTSVATIGSSSGIINGIATGTSTISYVIGTSCFATMVVTVSSGPGAITGATGLCIGASGSLGVSPSGGSWSTSNASVATVGSSGVVTSVSPGTAMISYSLGTGCHSTAVVTVLVTPTSISGTASTCVGVNTVLSSTGGSYWTSSAPTVAAVGSASGVVAGVSAGTATISVLNTTTGCYKTVVVTVNALPSSVTGTAVVCVGSTTTFSTASSGGSWVSGNTSVATVGSGTGIISGISAGTSLISYVSAAGCITTRVVTVNASTATISGTLLFCTGTSSGLGASVGGGTWSSSTPTVATIGSSGIVGPVSPGTSVISYVVGGCLSTTVVTVVSAPSSITGTATVCSGASTTLSSSPGGGSWSSSSTAVGTISSSGILTGIAAGTTIVTYSIGTSCTVTRVATVIATPSALTATTNLCVGASATLTGSPGGGTWSSSNSSVATVGTSGTVTAVGPGGATITYTASGCYATGMISVLVTPTSITGSLALCDPGTTTLSASPTGGSWSSSNPSIAAIFTSGVVAGLTTGTAIITYVLPSTCYTTAVVTVSAVPAAITGTLSFCAGATSTLSSATSGGTWSSSNPGIASVGSSTGIVTGIASGAATVSYTVAGCTVSNVVTVIATPSISGSSNTCVGITTALSAMSGGTWSSTDTSIAVVDGSGLVTGVAVGTATISYVLSSGCYATTVVTVGATSGSVSGTLTVCAGQSVTLSSSVSGGTWTSSNVSKATVDTATGVVSAISAGTVNITYAIAVGCTSVVTVTVNALPADIVGIASFCIGTTTTLSSSPGGGTWSSSNTAVGTVSSSGVVAGLSAGTTDITYILSSTGCAISRVVTVNTSAGTITGSGTICVGNSVPFTASVPGGTWSSSATAKASVGSATGIVTGVATGTAIITYRFVAGCETTTTVTVNSAIASVTGTNTICPGGTTTFSNTAGGGSWSSSNTAIGTINSSTGAITGISGGTAMISYVISSTGCYATRVLTVNPGTLSGSLVLCDGNSTTLTSTLSGGTWSSSNLSIVSVASSTGVVTGIGTGTATITYTRSGCTGTLVVTVNGVVAPISGPTQVCVGSAVTLTNATSGGTWVSGTTSRCTVGSTSGVVTGVSSGTSRISYIVSGSCFATRVQTVSAAGAIGGTAACLGATTTLSCSPSGGTWVSGNTSVVTIGSSSGVANAIATGTSQITYTTPIGCTSMRVVTIDAMPAAITGGTDTVCEGTTMTLSTASTGGTWSSTNTSVATVGSSGFVTTVGYGVASIRYSMPGGCYSQRTITVDINPGTDLVIRGHNSVVENFDFYSIISDSVDAVYGLGGLWSVSDTTLDSIAYADAIQAHIYGLSPGTTTVSYSFANSCGSFTYTKPVVVLPHSCDDVWGTVGGSEKTYMTGFGISATALATDRNGTPLVTYLDVAGFSGSLTVRRFDGVRLVPIAPLDLYASSGHNSDGTAFIAADSTGTPYLATSYSGSNTVYKWQGNSWDALASYGGLSVSSMAMGSDSRIYIGYSDPYSGDKATAVRYNGTGWDTLGAPGFSDGSISRPSITTGAGGDIYFAYTEVSDTARIVVKRYDGSSWVQIGGLAYESVWGPYVNELSIKVSAGGTPYVAYTTGGGGSTTLYVKKYTSAGWVSVGSGAVSDGYAWYISLAIDPSGAPVVAYRDETVSGRATVKRYSGSSWTVLGTSGFTGAAVDRLAFALDNEGNAYLSTAENYFGFFYKYDGSNWSQKNAEAGVLDMGSSSDKQLAMDGDTAYVAYISYNNKVCVRKLSNNSWNMLGSADFSSTGPQYLSMKVRSGIVYAAYKDASAAGKVTVMKYNGSSWTALGGAGISAGAASYVSVAIDNSGAPYVAYRDAANSNKVTVLKYNGSSWNPVGTAGFTAGGGLGVALAVTGSGVPFVSFSDSLNAGLVTVMKYNGTSWGTVGAPGFGYPSALGSSYAGMALSNTRIELDGNDTPYVAFNGGLYSPVFVRKFNGSDWVSLAPYPDWRFASSTGISGFSFALSSTGVPYVAEYGYPSGGYDGFKISTFNGYDWVTTGNVQYGLEDFGPTLDYLAYDAAMAVDASGVPYVAHRYSFAFASSFDPYISETQVQFKKRGVNTILGDLSICVGSHSYLKPERYSYRSAPGVWAHGAWSSSNTSVATVDTNGAVTGVSPGTATLSYMYYDCPATVVVTVNALPAAGTLSGASSVAIGSSITLSSSVSGGTWSSSSDAIATVGSSSGTLTGVAAGTVVMTYVVAGTCGLDFATHTVNVTTPRPAFVTGEGADGLFVVFPNPTSGSLNLETSSSGRAILSAIDGRIVSQYKVENGTTMIEVPAGTSPGVYMLRFEDDKGNVKVARIVYE